jgi:hypothetical protein
MHSIMAFMKLETAFYKISINCWAKKQQFSNILPNFLYIKFQSLVPGAASNQKAWKHKYRSGIFQKLRSASGFISLVPVTKNKDQVTSY